MNQTTYRRIVSGQDTSFGAGLLRPALSVFSLLYRCLIRCRNRFYDRELLSSATVDVPVICVGNITTGGTGKTPLVIWLCNFLREKGCQCAILTRGYKTEPGQMSDEPALLAKACGNTPVIVNSDRVAGAKKAIQEHHAQILIMDDGFQHRRLRRDMDILAVDATCPFGYGKMLPAGLLREPLTSLNRAQAAIITRADQANAAQISAIVQTLQRYAPETVIAQTTHKHTHATGSNGATFDLETLRCKKIFAFCGIGNPEAFFESLTQSGLTVVGQRAFDDHHAYTKAGIESVAAEARQSGADVVLCTDKDWSKCESFLSDKNTPVFASLAMKLDFIAGFDTITQQLETLVSQTCKKMTTENTE